MKLPDVSVVAVDTETMFTHPDDGGRVATVSAAWCEDGEVVARAWPFDQGVRDKFPTEQLDLMTIEDPNLGRDEWDLLCEWLRTRERIVYHNAPFDLAMLAAGTRHFPGVDLLHNFGWDSMIGSGELEPLRSRGLDAVAERIGAGGKSGVAEMKAWLRKNKYPVTRYDLVPWSLIEEYAAHDARVTYLAWREHMRRIFDECDERTVERLKREMDLTRVLHLMQSRGVAYDAARSLEAAEKLEAEADELEKQMPFKCSPKEAKAYFFDGLGLEPDRRSEKTEEPSLDEEQVRKWVAQDVEWAAEYAEVTKKRRAVSMWYRGYPEKIGPDGRLRTVYKQGHVKSGRMSVARVQLQAMPKSDKNIDGVPGVRELLRAEEGMGLWNLDLSQAELRVAAKYARCTKMQEMLEAGVDMHGFTCESIPAMEAHRDDPDFKAKRDIAKRLNFGGIFQIGGAKFQATLSKLADVHLPIEECNAYVQDWRRLYPEFGVAYRKADQLVRAKRRVRLLPGTPYEVESWFGERDFPNTGWNRIVQGSLAEFFKLWMIETEKIAPGRMILTVHDSVVLEAPLGEGDEAAAAVATRGAEMATELFKTEMKVDVDRW